MADKKISALTAATTPLAGTEVLPIVQGGATVKVAVSNLTAGRSFDALGMALTSTDAGAAAAPLLELYRDSASPAASDTLGEIEFNGEDSAGNKQAYGLIHASILSPTSTAEQGQLHFETATAGALTEKMIIGTTNLVINEIGAVFNVRIEGDTDANLFYTDATNSRVGVGLISPTEKFEVVGNIKLSGNVIPASGFGVDFAATSGTGTSELLADYEEGTWTPTFIGTGGSAGTVAYTSGGDYVKVGKQVTVRFNISVTNLGSWSGNARIGGLPFASAAGSDAIGTGYANAVTYVGTLVFATAGSSSIGLLQTSAGSSSFVAVSAISTSGYIYASLTYISN
jgi:hypothetical protein